MRKLLPKGRDLSESCKQNCELLYYSKFRFWTRNGWAIYQWMKKYPKEAEDHHTVALSIAMYVRLSESGKQKGWTPFLLKNQIWTANGWTICQWKKKHHVWIQTNDDFWGTFVPLENSSAICGSKSEFWAKKGVHPLCLPDSLKYFPLVNVILAKKWLRITNDSGWIHMTIYFHI